MGEFGIGSQKSRGCASGKIVCDSREPSILNENDTTDTFLRNNREAVAVLLLMKAKVTDSEGVSREVLLREYFLNASLLAALKQAGTEAKRLAKRRSERPVLAPVKVES